MLTYHICYCPKFLSPTKREDKCFIIAQTTRIRRERKVDIQFLYFSSARLEIKRQKSVRSVPLVRVIITWYKFHKNEYTVLVQLKGISSKSGDLA